MNDSPDDYDEETLRAVYFWLRDEHPEAACVVADQLLGKSAEEWALTHADEFADRLEFVRVIRSEFGLALKDAKEIADQHHD